MFAKLRAWVAEKRHRLAHRMHWQTDRQTDTVVTWWGACGRLWVGFKCSHCGEVTGADLVSDYISTPVGHVYRRRL